MTSHNLPCFSVIVIIGHADLTSENLEDVLQQHCQSKRFRGIRHMLNHHPDKPQYSETSHDNYLTDPVWRKGVELLEKYNLSFEMHVLPHQLKRAADVVKHFPKVMFMINHCGIPYDKDSETTKIWNDGSNIHIVSGVTITHSLSPPFPYSPPHLTSYQVSLKWPSIPMPIARCLVCLLQTQSGLRSQCPVLFYHALRYLGWTGEGNGFVGPLVVLGLSEVPSLRFAH